MTTKAERNLEDELGASPWPMFADEDEPWTDLDRLRRLDEKFDYQYEIAHVLGATESQLSYWMGKAREQADDPTESEARDCVHVLVCGNQTPGPKNEMCDTCLDLARINEGQPPHKTIDATEEPNMDAYFARLYAAYEITDDGYNLRGNTT